MFLRTTAINKLKAMKARKRVIQGGTSSGKTYGIIPVIIDRLCKVERLKATVVAETLPAVKEGALDIFKNVMFDTNRWVEEHWNASSLTYTFTNKSRIQFKSFDSVGKAKASGKRDILFLNEANHISFEIADALMIRSKETWIDFNPDGEFWVHKETLKEPNSEFCLINYEDNEALPPETLEDLLIKKQKAFFNTELSYPKIFQDSNIKDSYWSNWAKVYIYGQVGSLEGVIFNNWEQIDNIPSDARYIGNGLDFGYSNDPTACIDFYEWNGQIIWDEKIYQKGLLNSQIGKILRDSNVITVADSAEPKSIAEIRLHGVNIIPAQKGKDSISFGINIIQQRDFLVTKSSLNLIKELRGYIWKTDKSGKSLNVPIDDFNHAIDAARYFYLHKFRPNAGNYTGKTHGKTKRNTGKSFYKDIL
jgi:phage terminase large subunit